MGAFAKVGRIFSVKNPNLGNLISCCAVKLSDESKAVLEERGFNILDNNVVNLRLVHLYQFRERLGEKSPEEKFLYLLSDKELPLGRKPVFKAKMTVELDDELIKDLNRFSPIYKHLYGVLDLINVCKDKCIIVLEEVPDRLQYDLRSGDPLRIMTKEDLEWEKMTLKNYFK